MGGNGRIQTCVWEGAAIRGRGAAPIPGPPVFSPWQALPKAKRAQLFGSCFSQSLFGSHQLGSWDRAWRGLRMPVTVLNGSQLTLQHLLVMFPMDPSLPISFGPYWFEVMWSTWGAGGRVGPFSTPPPPASIQNHAPAPPGVRLESPPLPVWTFEITYCCYFFLSSEVGAKSSRPCPPSILSGGPGHAHSNDIPTSRPSGLEPILLHCYPPPPPTPQGPWLIFIH